MTSTDIDRHVNRPNVLIIQADQQSNWTLGAYGGTLVETPWIDSLARDGVTGCAIAEIEEDGEKIWRYTIELQVPEGAHCRAYVSEDRDRKSWNYCWLKGSEANPVSATCDDKLDDADFVDWKAKAVCGGQNFMAYCRREP